MAIRLQTLALGGVTAVAVAIAGMLAVPGCTVLTNDALPDDAGPFEGGGDAASTACGTCVVQECVGAWAVCLTDESCLKLRATCGTPFSESKGARDECFCAGAVPSDGGAGVDPLA